MLIQADVKGLEVVVAAELSNDEVLKQEIIDKVDFHEANRIRFGLGEGKPGRLVAKVFKFRTIYGGGAYSFAHDPDFTGVSSSVKFWEKVIEEYYTKYKGLKHWHEVTLVNAVKKDGYVSIPSGRYYPFKPLFNGREWKWPLTQIKNYPVQGLGADLVMLARIEAYRLLCEAGVEFYMVQTIHDSLVVDSPSKNIDVVATLLQQAVAKVPGLCYTNWMYRFSLPLTSEVLVGPNKKDMTPWVSK